MRSRIVGVLGVLVWLLPTGLPGAVSLAVTKPPVAGGGPTGPDPDPLALRGQWFQNSGVRPMEFYDNVPGFGGGFASSNAIRGVVTNIAYTAGPGTQIVGFDVAATITNDLGSQVGPWANGANAHGESLATSQHYVGPMIGTLLTVEFALNQAQLQPANWVPPYTLLAPRIVALNETDEAWYCFNPNVQPGGQGNFYVPAWDYGTIPIGQAVTQTLQFSVIDGGLLPADPRYGAIINSFNFGLDILSNRTTSLKISNWLDTVGLDPGGAYDPEADLHSNASVFHIPEAAAAMLGLAGAVLLLVRRRFVC